MYKNIQNKYNEQQKHRSSPRLRLQDSATQLAAFIFYSQSKSRIYRRLRLTRFLTMPPQVFFVRKRN